MACAINFFPTTFVSLDIDEVLSVTPSDFLLPLFVRKSTTIQAAGRGHCIIPGAIELIRYLHHTPGVLFGFCSTGTRERNITFVKELLRTALGYNECREIIETIPILSREDRKWISKKEAALQHEKFGIGDHTVGKKNLKYYGHPLEHIVHVDDRTTNMMPGQEKNLLHVPPSSSREMTVMYHLSNHYSARGYYEGGSIFYLHPKTSKSYINMKVRVQRDVFVQNIEGEISIHFYQCENECVNSVLLPKDSPLYHKLKNTSLKPDKLQLHIIDIDLKKTILDYIKPLGGTIEIFCHELNPLCYVAGILSLALAKSKIKRVPITTTLFKSMYKNLEGTENYYPVFDLRQRSDLYYRLGLKVLQRYTPGFSFITPYILTLTINSPMDEEERKKLKIASIKCNLNFLEASV
jgi:hypothetical protein